MSTEEAGASAAAHEADKDVDQSVQPEGVSLEVNAPQPEDEELEEEEERDSSNPRPKRPLAPYSQREIYEKKQQPRLPTVSRAQCHRPKRHSTGTAGSSPGGAAHPKAFAPPGPNVHDACTHRYVPPGAPGSPPPAAAAAASNSTPKKKAINGRDALRISRNVPARGGAANCGRPHANSPLPPSPPQQQPTAAIAAPEGLDSEESQLHPHSNNATLAGLGKSVSAHGPMGRPSGGGAGGSSTAPALPAKARSVPHGGLGAAGVAPTAAELLAAAKAMAAEAAAVEGAGGREAAAASGAPEGGRPSPSSGGAGQGQGHTAAAAALAAASHAVSEEAVTESELCPDEAASMGGEGGGKKRGQEAAGAGAAGCGGAKGGASGKALGPEASKGLAAPGCGSLAELEDGPSGAGCRCAIM